MIIKKVKKIINKFNLIYVDFFSPNGIIHFAT